MPKIKISIIIKASLLLIIHYLISKPIFIVSLASRNPLIFLGGPTLNGIVTAIIFLHIFSDKAFLRVGNVIRKKENKENKIRLKVLLPLGKFVTLLVIGIVGGPIAAAFIVRLLFSKSKYKYLLVILPCLPSTIFSMGLAKTALMGYYSFKPLHHLRGLPERLKIVKPW
jgi:hypothetical protein